jgi:hypothetical protein
MEIGGLFRALDKAILRADRGQSRSVHDSLRYLRSDRATPSAPARWALPSSAP